jgi:hypothetical protein
VLKLRRAKADFVNSNAHRGLRKLLVPLLGWKEGEDLTRQWAGKDPAAIERVDRTLAAAGMTMSTVMAQTFAEVLSEVERFDRLTAAAELGRNAMLREVAEHRSVFAAHLQRATAEIDDAGSKVIASPPTLSPEAQA